MGLGLDNLVRLYIFYQELVGGDIRDYQLGQAGLGLHARYKQVHRGSAEPNIPQIETGNVILVTEEALIG